MKPLETNMVIVARQSSHKKVASKRQYWVLLAIAVILFLFAFWGYRISKVTKIEDTVKKSSGNLNDILSGSTEGGISYYHCGEEGRTDHLVLLHGAAFTKEDWKKSGILENFCSYNLSVVALDLSVQADHSDLLAVLDDLVAAGRIRLPIAGLVTPSASGKTIIQGVTAGQISKLQGAIRRWVPVACNALLRVSEPSSFEGASSWPILAIYGDQDTAGKRSSELLNTWTGATVKELPGRHPCYLDSPKEFVRVVVQFLGYTL